jgi:hypothetical protein
MARRPVIDEASMSAADEVLRIIDDAFGPCEKPRHFTNYTHCEECAEHDALLRSRSRTTLTFEDIANPGWNPLCFSSAEGIFYFMPTLVRMAIDPGREGRGWEGDVLLFHLWTGGSTNSLLAAASMEQRSAIASLLTYFIETAITDDDLDTDHLLQAHSHWSS